jgi:hypothetical protein
VVEESLEHARDVRYGAVEADRVKDVRQEERPEKCRRSGDAAHLRRFEARENEVKDQFREHEQREGLLFLYRYLHRRFGTALGALSTGH